MIFLLTCPNALPSHKFPLSCKFFLLKNYLELYRTDTVCSESLLVLYCFTSSISQAFENYFSGIGVQVSLMQIFNKQWCHALLISI